MNNKKTSYLNSGFTMVEMLVVLAITAVLMGLLMIPLLKTLEANRMTAAYTNAQQNSRTAMNMIRKDISEAMYVADSSQTPLLLPVNGLVDADGNDVDKPVVMPYAVINLVMPKTEFYCKNPDHDSQYPRTFERGENYKSGGRELAMNECPYCHTDEFVVTAPKIPVEKSNTVVRYFLGLTDNKEVMTTTDAKNLDFWTVNNGMGWLPDSGDTSVEGDENPLILYRVEFDPVADDELFPEEYSLAGLDPDSEDYKNILHLRMTDANVFYHPDCCDQWMSICDNVGMLEGLDLAICSDSDYIDGHPFRVKNSVSFTPAAIAGETPIPNSTTNYAEYTADVAPTGFRTKYALLDRNIQVECTRCDPNTLKPEIKWVMKRLNGSMNYFGNIYKYPNVGDINPNLSNSDMVFDLNNYMFGGRTVTDFDQEMAFFYDHDTGNIDFSMNPDIDNISFNQDNLKYIPERDMYEYKFMPYENATIVPGSESVVYYNAYWTDSDGKSISELFYGYGNLKDNVEKVKYQKAPISTGYLNFNQYLIDYEKGYIYWKPVLEHNWSGNYPQGFDDIPVIENYKIQFNKVSDKITVSYMTNEVIDVNLSMRVIYDTYKSPRNGSINERVIVGNSLK